MSARVESVYPVEPGLELPPATDLVRGRPSRWLGLPVVWSNSADPIPVYIQRFSVPPGAGTQDAFLFGARYDLAEAEVGGESFAPGHFVEYFVVTSVGSRWEAKRLLHRGSVTYSESEEQGDFVAAGEVDDPRARSLAEPPRWAHPSEAVWPTANGVPMNFIGQVHLPRTPLTETKLTWDTTLYVFWLQSDGGRDVFKIVHQDPSAQSAEDHYADEDRRGA